MGGKMKSIRHTYWVAGFCLAFGCIGSSDVVQAQQKHLQLATGPGLNSNFEEPVHQVMSSFIETQKLTASDGASGDRLGGSVSVSGNRMLVGAHQDDDNGTQSGSVYVFEFDGVNWQETAKLTASDGAALDGFGNSVSLFGDRALIGAFDDDDKGSSSGSAYVFDFDGTNWIETLKLTASDGAAIDYFGDSVSLWGDFAIVGARADDDDGANSGSAYVFAYNGTTWNEAIKLTASDAAADDNFGWSVSMGKGRAVVGAHRNDDDGNDSGAAYVFEFTGKTWVESQKLTASDASFGDNFGWSVSISENRVLIGAVGDSENGSGSGSAYIFEYDGISWNESQKLTASDAATGDRFAMAVSLVENRALIGAVGNDDNGSQSGSAYLFEFDGTTWGETAKVIASDGAENESLGTAVSLSADHAVVGATGNIFNGTDLGAVYVFGVEPPPTCPEDVVISNYQSQPRGKQFIEITNVGRASFSLAGCSLVAYDGATELSIADASLVLEDWIRAGETLTVPFSGELPEEEAGVVIMNRHIAPPDATPLMDDLDRVITAIGYTNTNVSHGGRHLTQPAAYDPIYACIYGGNIGTFKGPFASVKSCFNATPKAEHITPQDALLDLFRAIQSGPQSQHEETPSTFALEQNYPNPFNPQTTIRFGLQEAATVQLTVYDLLGRPVQTLIDGAMSQGWHEATFNATNLPSGLYLYRLTTPMGTIHQTMTLTK